MPDSSLQAYLVNGGTATITSTATCSDLILGNGGERNPGNDSRQPLRGGARELLRHRDASQSGGTNNSPTLEVGTWASGNSVGTYDLGGSGQVFVENEYVGYNGTGTFTQSGGTNSTSSLFLACQAGSSGTYNLAGGVLVLPALAQGPSAATFNFSGGTLQASNGFSTTLPMTLGSSGGGATFDTAGFNLGLFGSLSGSGSLTKVDSGSLILAGVNSFSNGTTIAGGP